MLCVRITFTDYLRAGASHRFPSLGFVYRLSPAIGLTRWFGSGSGSRLLDNASFARMTPLTPLFGARPPLGGGLPGLPGGGPPGLPNGAMGGGLAGLPGAPMGNGLPGLPGGGPVSCAPIEPLAKHAVLRVGRLGVIFMQSAT
jgi:hypothetical protein